MKRSQRLAVIGDVASAGARDITPSANPSHDAGKLASHAAAGHVAPSSSPVHLEVRPIKRGDCADGPRPCPWVGCRSHLLDLRIHEEGALSVGDLELAADADPWAVERFSEAVAERVAGMSGPTCVLDVVDKRQALTLKEVGDLLNVTRERIRQIEAGGTSALSSRLPRRGITRDSLR